MVDTQGLLMFPQGKYFAFLKLPILLKGVFASESEMLDCSLKYIQLSLLHKATVTMCASLF